MSHIQQREFCAKVKWLFPSHFKRANVIDVGSLDINGNNRWLFSWPNVYVGVDVINGKNVNVVSPAHIALPMIKHRLLLQGKKKWAWPPDVIISTEMLEHDQYWQLSLEAMYDALRPGGLLLITAAGDDRPEHGTHKEQPECSPGTLNYYKNISNQMFMDVLPAALFTRYCVWQDKRHCDFTFFGIKK
jgi:SAM-dependent methyltransferase